MLDYLFLDLDHTILYSHRQKPPGNVIWVEQLNGKPQSWITKRCYQFFKGQESFHVIPVTTRIPTQFQRLSGIMNQLQWNHALTCNGAILTQNGSEDIEWKEESIKLCQADYNSWQYLRMKAGQMFSETNVITMEPFLFYIRNNDPYFVMQNMKGIIDPHHVKVYKDSRKVYCVANANSKGNAVRRYMNLFGDAEYFTAAAGDSDIDISMLNAVDLAFIPKELRGKVSARNQILCNGLFSDEICERLYGLDEVSLIKPVSDEERGRNK